MFPLIGARQGVSAVLEIETSQQATKSAPSNAYRPLLADFLVRFCISVTIGVGLLLAVELYAYWHQGDRGKDEMDPVAQAMLRRARGAERNYWLQFAAAEKVMYHPYVLWRRAPFHGNMINIDENGVRATTHSDCTDPNFTIWMFGDSTMWGVGSTDDQTIASQLAADYERARHKACIVNFGEKAWVSTQELIALIQQLKHAPRKPNAVVFYDGGIEAVTAYQTHQADMPTNYRSFKLYLETWSAEQQPGFSYLSKSNTNRLLNGFAKRVSRDREGDRKPMSEAEVEALSAAVIQNYTQNMDIIRVLAQHYGFRPIFVWYPALVVGHKQLTPFEQQALADVEEQFPGMPRIYRAAYRRCQKIQDRDLYYLGDIFDDQKESIFLSISHVKPEGNRIVADRLLQILENPPQAKPGTDSKPSQAAGKRLLRSNPA